MAETPFALPDHPENPWQTLTNTTAYDNPWIRLEHHEVLNPAGRPGIYGKIHYKNTAIGVVPYENGYIWLVGQYRYVLDRYSWEIPEGGGGAHESWEEAAARELREETGLSAAVYQPIVQMHLSNSVSDEFAIIYLATGLTHGEAEPEETEDLRLRRVHLHEAYTAVESGQITDSLTVAAIYKLMLMEARGLLPAD